MKSKVSKQSIHYLKGDKGGDLQALWPNKLQFEMLVSYISVGIFFQQCARLLLQSKEITGRVALGNISLGKEICIVQLAFSYNFEVIKNIY